MTAFVLGNGVSRKGINLYRLEKYGDIYGCNALYREFTPKVLVATDPGISRAIQESGYSLSNRFYTRKPFSDSGALALDPIYKGMSSGPNALNLACKDGHKEIFLLGMDFGSVGGLFNNMYADTEFYKKSTDKPTFSGNWMNQIKKIIDENKYVRFIRVVNGHSQQFNIDWKKCKNYNEMPIDDFLNEYK